MYIRYMSNSFANEIFFPYEMINNFEFIPKRMILNIGAWKKEVEVKFTHDLDKDCIGLSKYMTNDFMLPDSLTYEIKIENNNIHLGPIIAFLIENKKKYIPNDRLERLKPYYINYNDIRGAIFICAVDQIDITKNTIEGFYYNGTEWETTIFPYPGCIYRKTDIPDQIYDNLTKHLGNKIFNGYFFDKWEMWEALSPNNKLREHLPHTHKLECIEDLDYMLDLYDFVYLKQTKGYKAKGILKVNKSEEGYHFTTRLKGTTTIDNKNDADKFIKELNEKKRGKNFYIVQEAINLKRYQNRPYDFRVVLQKDKYKQWGCSSIIARFGKRKSIATNFLLSGYALTGYEAIKRVFKTKEKETFLKQREIIELCIEACKALEKCFGNYGDIGIDVMIDENKKVWILEVNKTHDHRFPLYSIENVQLYHDIISKPFEYAKTLAGF